ncbi:hypothetical protein EsDP_00003242 [Epichloe bromicola]|uniref:Uncharacterized protein n=1 Tax=Epichloe bromicola TaxID=79588 RepID=A0ABQ0CN68_9HYPO
MRTAKSQMDLDRRQAIAKAEEEYLGQPPSDEILFETILILPAMFELADASCFDALRKAHQVWIVQENPNTIHMHSRTPRNLDKCLEEINWATHDMRLAQYNFSNLFLVQLPIRGECPIKVDLDCRPQASPQIHSEQLVPIQEASHIANDIMKKVRQSFISSTDALQRRLKHTLQMRVDFGHVIIRRRKKVVQGNGNEMPYTEFVDMASQYGRRGGADFEARLEGSKLASNTIRHLLQPTAGFFNRHQNITCHDTISIKLQKDILEIDVIWLKSGPARLKNARLMTPGQWPILRWIVIAPDREYDWYLRVDSGHTVQPIPTQILSLVNSIIITSDGHKESTEEAFLQKPINIRINNPQLWKGKVDDIQVCTNVAIPFRDTPYVMEVSINRLWKGVDTQTSPQSWQSLGFYGVHWAAELNCTNANGTRKDWGANQRDVWRGSAPSAEGQFKEFICYVLEGLSALEGALS